MRDIDSNTLMDAMLAHQLSGNEIKMILAYVRLGGWKAGAEVFLPEAKRIEWDISDATAKRVRKSLKEKGWLKTTGNKSRYGCDKYTIHIPATPRVDQNELGRSVKMIPQVGQNDPSGSSKRPLEVTKEVPKEVTKISNEGVLDAKAPADAVAFNPILNDKEVKEYSEETPALLNEENSPAFLNVPVDTGVAQNEPPLDDTENFLRMRKYWQEKDAARKTQRNAPVVIGGLEW